MESPENNENKKEIESLMVQVKQLESENQNLYSQIIKMSSKKNSQSLEYYVRLRKDLISEQSKLSQRLSELNSEKEKENLKIILNIVFKNIKILIILLINNNLHFKKLIIINF